MLKSAKISSAVIIFSRDHASPASKGICSIKRKFKPSLSAHCTSAIASSSLVPRMSTELIFSGVKPAARAASIPAKTSLIRSLKVNFLKRSRSRVSNEILIRLKPASTKGCANLARAKPLVVIESLGGLDIALIRATISTISGRSSGSPPVKRISFMPCETAASITAINSSVVSRSSLGSQALKS